MTSQFPPEIILMMLEELVKMMCVIDLCHDPKALDKLLQYFTINRQTWQRRNGVIWPNIQIIERIFFNEFPMLLTLPTRHLQHIQRVELRLLKMPGLVIPSHFSDLPHVLRTMNNAIPALRELDVVIPGCESVNTWAGHLNNSYEQIVINSTAATFDNHCGRDIKIFLRLQWDCRDDEHPNGPAGVGDIAEALLSYPPGKVGLVRW